MFEQNISTDKLVITLLPVSHIILIQYDLHK
jgi:hypothetical protein